MFRLPLHRAGARLLWRQLALRLTPRPRVLCQRRYVSTTRARAADPSGQQKINPHLSSPISWKTLLFMTLPVMAAVAWVRIEKEKLKEQDKRQKQIQSHGEARIGVPFTLIGSDGQKVSDEDFRGRWVILYFGFTHCPDVCPDELEKIADVTNSVAADKSIGVEVQPLFITIDPQRDTPKIVEAYVKEFHPKMIGLSGDEESIAAVCKGYRVYHSKSPADDEDPDDYLVDHTIITYLLNPDGKFETYFTQTSTPMEAHEKIAAAVNGYRVREVAASRLADTTATKQTDGKDEEKESK